jgi:hypothetical protein
MSKSSSAHKRPFISAFCLPMLIGLVLFLLPAGEQRAADALAQSPPKPEVSVTIWDNQTPVVLRINDIPQGTGPSGSGPVADNVLIYILLDQCDPAALTAELEVWAETYDPATDDESEIRQQIGTISPLPGQPDYLFSWHPDSAMPSGLYQIVVEGECMGISDNRIQIYDRRDYPLFHNDHFTTARIYYGDTALYGFDEEPLEPDQACLHEADSRPTARYWVEGWYNSVPGSLILFSNTEVWRYE